MKKVVIVPSAGILALTLLIIVLATLRTCKEETKLVAKGVSSPVAGEVAKKPKGEEVSQQEVKEEKEQGGTDQGQETKKEELLTLDRDPFLFYPEKHGSGDVQEEIIRPEEVGLNGIIYDPENPRVIIQDQIVGVGDEVGGKRIEKIEPDKIILIDIQRNMRLICPLEEEKR